METVGSPAVSVRKPTLTPKAIIHQKFGSKACYKVEEVHETDQNGCPGLAIPQKGPCIYRCSLQLPDFSVVSETFKKKKDAEQSAAEKALEKLSIHPTTNSPTLQEAWDSLQSHITYLFSDKFLSSSHPLSGHFREALLRAGDRYGSVPTSVIAACDSKLTTLSKLINPKVESNPFLVVSYIMTAAARLSDSVVTSESQLSIRRKNLYPSEVIESSLVQRSESPESIWIEAIHIPSAPEEPVQAITLNISSTVYYLDVIAQRLGLEDANNILVSRTIGKASSETRLYFAAPKSYSLDLSSDLSDPKEEIHFEGSLNARASYFYCHDIYGDAILASIGYTWKDKELFHENVNLQSYNRMLISKIPSGIYKLSREAILATDLPFTFTTRTNWRGSFPREILCVFCRQHQLSEPVFSTSTTSLETSCELSRSPKKLKVSQTAEQGTEYANGGGSAAENQESVGSGSRVRCKVKLYSKSQDLLVECSPKEFYVKQSDAIQNASLKILSWLNVYLKDMNVPLEKLNHFAEASDIRYYPDNFFKGFAVCISAQKYLHSQTHGGRSPESNSINMLNAMPVHGVDSVKIEGPNAGVCPCNGSLSCINYSVSLVTDTEHVKELLESKEFEFEIGTGAVVPYLEAVVTQMSTGQSACFYTELLPREFILAASQDAPRILSLLSSKAWCLEYCISLLRVTEPPEDRMEQALFKPPLSKQRVEYAVQHIKESSATTLVDFGCGSGSLLDSLLDYPTALERIAGVDISQKSLSRAAKMLHTRLSSKSDPDVACANIKSAVLYDGSITQFDSRLLGLDIGTCLEVIEHMEEEQAYEFGEVVLSYFCPRILIVSTPNYEYNVILQRSHLMNQEDDPDEKTQSEACKFRNHDHKFEWTRQQFNHWASDLAARHNYSVEFSGVGGSGDIEPGFASQIAVFRRGYQTVGDNSTEERDLEHHYKVIWEWNCSGNTS